jgi:bifunctional oligoribonuclease and PAP phosphatase NrnA
VTTETPAWLGDIDVAAWDAAVAAIREVGERGASIVLVCHEHPDGDALGSMLALHLFLRRLGYDTAASWAAEPLAVPPQYTFLPALDTLVPPSALPDAPELLICFDASSTQRLGSLATLVERAQRVIVVDHHRTGEQFGDIALVAPRSAATAVVVEELIRRLGGEPDRDIATCLYTGVVTDTGRFQYANTDASVLELGGRLMAQGIEHTEMSRQMFDTHSFGYLKLPGPSLVYSWLDQEDLAREGVAFEELDAIIDVVRSADTAEVAMILKQDTDGTWRVSLRSKGAVDVGVLAKELGGGGHSQAAGFTAHGSVDDVVRRVVERLPS